MYPPNGALSTPDWVKGQLAAGREVAFGVSLDKDGATVNDVWMPGKTSCDCGHAMLFVGYDDSKQAFLLKNSWGAGWQEAGYGWFSYDWFTQGKIDDAAVVYSVMPSYFGMPTQQLFLGRYGLDYDGWQSVLDIYHVPDSNTFHFASGDPDNRLGTFYGPDGQGRRVNGILNGRTIDFYVDWNNTGARGYGELTGMHFTGYLAADNQMLAGTMLDNRDGGTYGFYGHKVSYLPDQAAGTINDLTAYVGHWSLYGQDISNSFSITAVEGSTGTITGTEFGGSPLSGTVSVINKRSITFQDQGQTYQGYIFSYETGLIAGIVSSGSATAGFVAMRSAFGKPQVSIISPVDQVSRRFSVPAGGPGQRECRIWVPDRFALQLDDRQHAAGLYRMHPALQFQHERGTHHPTFSNGLRQCHGQHLDQCERGSDPPVLPVINSISIDATVVIAAPNAAQQPDPLEPDLGTNARHDRDRERTGRTVAVSVDLAGDR